MQKASDSFILLYENQKRFHTELEKVLFCSKNQFGASEGLKVIPYYVLRLNHPWKFWFQCENSCQVHHQKYLRELTSNCTE